MSPVASGVARVPARREEAHVRDPHCGGAEAAVGEEEGWELGLFGGLVGWIFRSLMEPVGPFSLLKILLASKSRHPILPRESATQIFLPTQMLSQWAWLAILELTHHQLSEPYKQ